MANLDPDLYRIVLNTRTARNLQKSSKVFGGMVKTTVDKPYLT
jgi:hypothetical protein